MTPTELSRTSLLTPGAMTNRVDRLVAAGLVSRDAEPTDRRGVRVTLSKKGLALVDRAIAARFAEADSAVATLSAREQATLEKALRRLLNALEREADSKPTPS
jgi:DNA-binding MarR family transcriptional regulator